jgi:hypothetical protein
MLIGGLIPVSDSGKAEEAGALRICFSFDRGFAPASCAKITFRNQELFGYFLADKKYQTKHKSRTDFIKNIINSKAFHVAPPN